MMKGIELARKVDSAVKEVSGGNSSDNKKKDADKNKKKGRPTCKRDEEDEKLRERMERLRNPNTKFIGMQFEKLENMHVILTAEDGNFYFSHFFLGFGKILDEFEREF